MTRPDYLNFSRVQGKEQLNALVDEAAAAFMRILEAPNAAKENLMRTDFKTAVAASNLVRTVVQAESANTMAMAVLAQRMERSHSFIEANVPGLKSGKEKKQLKD